MAREDLEAFTECLLDRVVVDMFESREGGRPSRKVAVDGDCSLDDGTDATTGDDTAVPAGLLIAVGELLGPAKAPLAPSWASSLTPPTEALMRL